MDKTPPWAVPAELAAYDQFTSYPGRAAELMNHPANFFNNAIVATMRAETGAQWELLASLHAAGLLKAPAATD